MKLLKWLSVADRFAKSYLDERLAPLGLNSSQHMYLLKVCDQPGISQDSLLEGLSREAQADFQNTLFQVGKNMALRQGVKRVEDEFDG